MMTQKKSIRFRLMRVILITSASVLLLTFAFFFLYEFLSYRQITLGQLNTLSGVIASNSTAALAFESPDDAHEILSALKAGKNIDGACIYTKKNVIFSHYPDGKSILDFPSKPGPDGFRFSDNFIEGFVPIEQDGMRVGTLYIKRDLDDLYERLGLYSFIAFIVIGLSFLMVRLLSQRLQSGISLPIIALSETALQISLHHNYAVRAKKQTDGEIGVLTDAFNTMLSQIEIQNKEIEAARKAAYTHAQELEIKVNERTIEYKKQRDFAEIVVNSSLVLITVYDTETRIIGYNKKCEEEFGLKREDVLGKKYLEVFPGMENTIAYTSLLRSLQGETIHNPQYQSGVTGDYYESYTVPLRNDNNDVYAVLMTAHNITQIVEAAEKLKKSNAELRDKNEELEQFAYVASHDLQEPLRKIRMFIQLVKNNTNNLASATRYMEKVETSAERMSSLIHDVLEYSRLSQIQETFTDVDLNQIVENVKLDFELFIAQHEARIQHDVLPVIRGNKLQMHQLFSNLINNSIKFSDTKPRITITSAPLLQAERDAWQELDPAKQYIQLAFADNGIGFDQQYADRIFTIFQRLNTRDKYEGTGIGLALCKKIVQNHNGYISVTSAPGKGTTFLIILPQG